VIDTEALTRDASLNKLVVPAYEGRSGGDLLSRDALVELASGMPVSPSRVADDLSSAVEAGDARAFAIVDEFARRLAAVVATLGRPETAERQGVTPLRRVYLEHWANVEDVFVGGGLMAGAFGRRVAEVSGLRLASHPQHLALIGAARSVDATDGDHLVMDGGHSSLKRAWAHVADGQLEGLTLLSSISTAGVTEEDMSDFLSPLIADAPTTVTMSVAAYLRDGRPIPYGASIYEKLDSTRQLRLLHDGTAAWRGIVDSPTAKNAVIVLGSWLGVGLGPQSSRLLPVSPTERREGVEDVAGHDGAVLGQGPGGERLDRCAE
jgi:hypothetical protein